MTYRELISDWTTILRAALSCPVEEYERLDPPTVLRVQVVEGDEGEGEENANDLNKVSGGTHFQRMHVQMIVETPWDEKKTTAEALDTAVETIKAAIWANRTIDGSDGVDADVSIYHGQVPFFLTYPGTDQPWIKGRDVTASWRV